MSIIFDNYTPPPPPKGTIDIRIGVFFDGTMNNRTNTNARLGTAEDKAKAAKAYKNYGGGNSSYENDWSNIARLETAYTENLGQFVSKVYIEGIGTEDYQNDSAYFTKGAGAAFGTGSTGIIAKVLKGCEKAVEKIGKIKNKEKINCIYLDVFGFSRGAAAARNFVYEVSKQRYYPKEIFVEGAVNKYDGHYIKVDDHNKPTDLKILPKYGHLGLMLSKADIDVVQTKVKVSFVGLFDTVSSYSPNSTTSGDFENDVAELQLNAISKAKKIFHLVAADEHRVNFMLTSVKAAGGSEYVLPGVHSDVGGSYVHNKPDNVQLLDFDNTWGDGYLDEEWDKVLNNDLNNLIAQGWYTKGEVVRPNKWHETYGNRKSISNKYSYVPLHIMGENTNEFHKKTIDLDILNQYFKIPNGKGNETYPVDLTAVKVRLDNYIKGKKPLMKYYTNKQIEECRKQVAAKKITVEEFNLMANDHNMLYQLRNKYFHWSAKFGETGLEPNFEFKDKFNIRRFRKTAKDS